MAMIDGIHFFKAKKADTLAIIKSTARSCSRYRMTKSGTVFTIPKPLPSRLSLIQRSDAIQNVFALALKRDPEIKHFNPLALWDLHYLREIDDSEYINRLYG